MITSKIRTFETGANRDSDEGKIDFEGHLSPLALQAFGEYMNKHRLLLDGTYRDSDNWQKGMPDSAYMKSMFRHFMAVWQNHRGWPAGEAQEEALCGLLFNVQGMLHNLRHEKAMELKEGSKQGSFTLTPHYTEV